MIIVIQLLLFIKSTECVYLVNMAVYRPCNNKSIYLKNTKYVIYPIKMCRVILIRL